MKIQFTVPEGSSRTFVLKWIDWFNSAVANQAIFHPQRGPVGTVRCDAIPMSIDLQDAVLIEKPGDVLVNEQYVTYKEE